MNMKQLTVLVAIALLSACSGGTGESGDNTTAPATLAPAPNPPALAPPAAPPIPTPDPAPVDPLTLGGIDSDLFELIEDEGLTGTPAAGRDLPSIDSPIATLGKFLFFTMNLGGENDAACVSCHHPVLGGGDNLSMAVGVHAVDVNNIADAPLLGPGRHPETAGASPLVPRNAPTVFNAGLQDRGMFWDSRVSSLNSQPGANGSAGQIATPDSAAFNQPDTTLPAGTSLPAAQARFPVTSSAEMRADFEPDLDNQAVRGALASRFNDALGNWASLFVQSFGDDNITFDRIGTAIGEYERSMDFTNSPWNRYVSGELDAITDQQKEGAVLFFTPVNEGGGGCSRCHSGDTFSDARHHLVAFPQMSDDLGRENVNDNPQDRYHFRTPSLLNVAVTAPYGHAGLYSSLEEVIRHYDNPRGNVDRLFGGPRNQPFTNANVPVCQLPQISRILAVTGDSCESLMTDAYNNSIEALDFLAGGDGRNPLGPRPNLNNQEVAELAAFLEALTDPCVTDRTCLDPWIVDNDDLGAFPDNSALVAHDEGKLDL